MKRLYTEPAWRITSLLVSGDVSVEDYEASIYESFERLEDKVNAYITLRPL